MQIANRKRWFGRPSHVGYGGSIRAGKTQAAGRLIAAWAWRFPADYLVIRKTFPRLRDSTMKAMWHGDGGLKACIPSGIVGDYRYSDQTIVTKTGGRILFRHAEHPHEAIEAFKNMTLGGYFIDQVEELDHPDYEELFNTLEGRLSQPGTPQTGLGVSNPGPEDHWYHRRVVDPDTRDDNANYVHTTLFDNEHNLQAGYVTRMKRSETSRPDWYKRYILGEWGAFGGKRFKTWDPDLHIVEPFEIPSEWEVIEGGDYGWANPFAWVFCAMDHLNRWYVFAEHFASETRISEHAKAIERIRDFYGVSPSSTWFDPSAWAVRGEYESPVAELQDHGIWAAKAVNDRLGGWNRIDEMLTTMVEDPYTGMRQPQLVLMRDRAPNLERELPSLKIKEGTDDVAKRNDHASDALRYAISSRQPPPPPPKPDRHLEYVERKLQRLANEHETLYVGGR